MPDNNAALDFVLSRMQMQFRQSVQIICGLFLIIFLLPGKIHAQDTVGHIKVPARVIDGDTIASIDMRAVVIFPAGPPMTVTMLPPDFYRLVYNVKKVYPFAKLAAVKLLEYQKILDTIHSDREKKKFIKLAQKQLEAEFGSQVRDLTITQGKILIKLIYRETGNSTFGIIKELRGSFTAFIWQTVATIFGYDLKTQYQPDGDDQAIEKIILMIEAGEL
ncbi:MAG: DUF4294 domain-containing protein [Bacteroidota bacterium]|nr:DUF4294 domain-containing protein [Bacteroidota bacterium]